MGEPEWLACKYPGELLRYLLAHGMTVRKSILYVVAAARLSAPQYPRITTALEEYADGKIGRPDLDAAYRADGVEGGFPYPEFPKENAVYVAPTSKAGRKDAVRLIRDIFGNPFRPVAFDRGWRTDDVLGLARGVYEDRAFDRLPILADALQDAGCDSEDILGHCRFDSPHVRGCWVVDLVLGKE